jgi:hypothetical protein
VVLKEEEMLLLVPEQCANVKLLLLLLQLYGLV